jgi:UDP-2-acetamido-3-amino-2,3-dideoxy-glucuronate N-acetyltransferase
MFSSRANPTTSSSLAPASGVVVVGGGYWGKNLVRNFAELQGLVALVDTRPEVLASFKQTYPCLATYTTLDEALTHPAVAGVVIATPSPSHAPLAKQALLADKAVYVEKPLATNFADAQALVALSQQRNQVLMVGHLLVYHPVVNRVRYELEQGVLGPLQLIESYRLNWNVPRHDRNVWWDLAPHDLSMIQYLTQLELTHVHHVQATTTRPDDGKADDVLAQFELTGGLLGRVHTSWVSPTKRVTMRVQGEGGAFVFDDTLPPEQKLKFVRVARNGHREERALEFLPLEPLKLECQHFLNALHNDQAPQTNATTGMAIVRWLDQVQAWLTPLEAKAAPTPVPLPAE